MHDALPYVAGIGSTLCYGTATALEQIAVRRQSTIQSLHPSHILRLLQQLPFLLGIFLDLVGWLLFLFAARSLPLFLDLSFVAASLVVSAIIAQIFLSTRSSSSERKAMALVIVGIVLLGVVAEPTSVKDASNNFRYVLEFAPVPLALIGLSWLKSDSNQRAPLILAACAGLAFGATGLISRILNISQPSAHALLQPMIAALIFYGVLGFIFLSAALQKASINRVNSMLYGTELAIPSLIGILFLGDRARHGFRPLAMAGFLCVIIGTIGIARDKTSKKQRSPASHP